MENKIVAPPAVDYNSPAIRAKVTERLNSIGFAVNPAVPDYALADTLRRFQAAVLNPDGSKLSIDGGIGEQTVTALFTAYVPKGATLRSRVLAVAASQVGVSEVPPGSNKGPQVKMVLRACGLPEGYAWCSAFMAWSFQEAARQMLLPSDPYPDNAGVLNQWELAGYKESGLKRITPAQAKADPTLIKPGMAGLLKLGDTAGHIFLIESVAKDGRLTTIEGNTNNQLSREGTGVFRLSRRTISNVNLGFIDYINSQPA